MIHVINRHCKFSAVSVNKSRPEWFSKHACFSNLPDTARDWDRINTIYILDGCQAKDHDILKFLDRTETIIEINENSEVGSFHALLDTIENLKCNPDDIVYSLEDDYLHRNFWDDILVEGINIPGVSYVSLYDHKDKYFLPEYQRLTSQILYTESCHWRTTPSTTNTYAAKYKIWLEDMEIHRKFSVRGEMCTRDHQKFLELGRKGRVLVTPIPGYATHVETNYLSPVVDWTKEL